MTSQVSTLGQVICKEVLYLDRLLYRERAGSSDSKEFTCSAEDPSSIFGLERSLDKWCPTLCNTGTVACQTPLSIGFPKQECWSGLPFHSPGDLPDPHLLCLLHWQVDSLPLHHVDWVAKEQTFISHISEDWEIWDQDASHFSSQWEASSWFAEGHLLLVCSCDSEIESSDLSLFLYGH